MKKELNKEDKLKLISEEDEESLNKGEKLIIDALKNARIENRTIVKSPALTNKISKYIESHGLNCSVDYIYKKMEEDDGIVASMFGKEPLKQNFTEKFIFKYIKEHANILDKDAINYPSGTKTYFIRSKLCTDNSSDDKMKTIDFKFIKNGISYYCTQKYTTTNGSNQDDRYTELLHFVRSNSLSTLNSKIVIVALADGSYFKNKASRYKTESSYFKYLKENAGFCKVMTYLQFVDFLNKEKNE